MSTEAKSKDFLSPVYGQIKHDALVQYWIKDWDVQILITVTKQLFWTQAKTYHIVCGFFPPDVPLFPLSTS